MGDRNRWEQIKDGNLTQDCIKTGVDPAVSSGLPAEGSFARINYWKYLNDSDYLFDKNTPPPHQPSAKTFF